MTNWEWFQSEAKRCHAILATDSVIYINGRTSHDCAHQCLFELNLIAPEFGLFDANGKLVGLRSFDLEIWRMKNADFLN